MLALALALLPGLALVAGCGEDGQQKAAAARAHAQAVRHARALRLGRAVFAEHCHSCHTLLGSKAHPTFIESPIPNLDEVQPRRPYVDRRVEYGGFDMPSFRRELSEAEYAAVVTYVTEVAGRDVDPPSTDTARLALGEQVFRAHCERCHAIDGREKTGRPTFRGTDFREVKPSVELVLRQARKGIPEEMPSFRGTLTEAQLQAVAAYVNATAAE
jgi:cbb3-type cytochrome c oxidase subunit III